MENKEKKLSDLLKQDEFYLADLFQIAFSSIRKSKKIVIVLLACIIVLFTLDYTISPIEFESKATVMVEQQSSTNNNSLSSLLGLSNNMASSNGNGDLGPGMYSELFKSQVFLNEIIQTKFPISQDSKDSVTLEQYFSNGENLTFFQKIKNPSTFFSPSETKKDPKKTIKEQSQSIITNSDSALIIKKNINPELIFSNQIPPIVQIDEKKATVIGIMKKRIRLELKDKNVIVYTKMPTAFLSAIVDKMVLENLLNYITAFKTHKQLTQIEFLERRVIESEEKYKRAQQNFAGYKDNTLGIILQSAQTREQILNNELSIAFNIYNQFAVQLEQAKVDLKKETPYFSILEPITIPGAPIEPSISSYIIKYLALFVIGAFIIVLYKLFF